MGKLTDWRRRLNVLSLISAFGLVIFGLAGAYLIAMTPGATPVEKIEETLQYLLSPWMLATEAVGLAFLGFGYYFLKAAPWKARDTATFDSLLRRQRQRLLLAFGLFALVLAAIGLLFCRDMEHDAYDGAFTQTRTIARLKAQQVDKWLYERSIDAELGAAALAQIPIDRWADSEDTRQYAGVLLSEILAGHPERIAVSLFTADRTLLAGRGRTTAFNGDTVRRIDNGARKSRLQIVETPLVGNGETTLGVSFVLPIAAPGSDRIIGILNITVDPSIDLLQHLSEWPTPSASGEIALVRREGNDIVHLMRPRLMDPGMAAPHASLAMKDSPAAHAIFEGDGARAAEDYRHIPVITASARVRGIDWYVIDKIDVAEAMGPAQRRIHRLLAVIAGTLVLAALTTTMLWHGQHAGLLAYRERKEEEITDLTRHYEIMTGSMRDSVFLTDAEANIIDCNAAAEKNYGYTRAEILTMNARQFRAPDTRPHFEKQWSPATDREGTVYHTAHRRKDGTTFPVELSNNAFEIDGVVYTQAVVRDISERRAFEQQIARLVRVERALFKAGGVLLRAKSEDELFCDTCRILVEDGGYRLANVAVPEHDAAKSIRFVTVAGPAAGYVANINITWGEGPHGKGPTGAALREGTIQVNQDFTHNPSVTPWREAAQKWKIQASIALPLRCHGELVGALTIYAEQPNAFDAEELSLLTRLADNVGYGLEKLRGISRP